jgi:hypothetical protein
MRPALLLLALIAAAALFAVPAAAKDGVRAKLDEPVRLGTAPGKTIRVAWRLVDRKGRRFGASGIYLRVSRCGRRPMTVPADDYGLGAYSARLKVPKGGIRKLVVGLPGWQIIGDKQKRADMFFQFDPPLVRRCS